jgi:hypothetical protein
MNLSRGQVIGAWFGLLAVTIGTSLLLGATATPGTWTFLCLAALTPPAICLALWRPEPPTISELVSAVRTQDRP